jgi:tetratricopeptide (TPR) repeat protein
MAARIAEGRSDPAGPRLCPRWSVVGLRIAFLGAWMVMLSACAGVAPERPEAGPEPQAQGEAAPRETGPKAGLDADTLYKLLVAEFAGHRGQLKLSLASYLEVAQATRDPRVAERATRIAVYARDDQAALAAASLWAELSPQSHEAHRVLASLYIREGRVDAAVDELNALVGQLDAKPAQEYALVVEILARERDKDTVMAVMERFVATRKDSPEAQLAYANLAIRVGELDQAAAILAKLQARHPDYRGAILLHVTVLQEQGKTEEALKTMARLKELEPDNVSYRMAYARLLVSAKRFDDALVEFRGLSKQRPDDADVRYALALLLLQTNRLDQAEVEFEELIKLNKKALTARYYLGQLAETQDDLPKALDWYRGVDSGQHYVDAQVRVAVIYAKQKKLADARAHLHGIQPQDSADSVRLNLVESELLADAGKRDQAMEVYDNALEEFPENTDLLYARAMLAEKMGRLDLLEADLRTILEKEPNNAQALNALGYTLADRTERYQEAYDLIERALKLKPDDYYILDSKGWILYRMGRLPEALKYLRRAAELSQDPEISAHLGEVLWVMGDQKGARDVWNSALKTTPDDERLLEVIRRFSP